jgi:hypothetical protein
MSLIKFVKKVGRYNRKIGQSKLRQPLGTIGSNGRFRASEEGYLKDFLNCCRSKDQKVEKQLNISIDRSYKKMLKTSSAHSKRAHLISKSR